MGKPASGGGGGASGRNRASGGGGGTPALGSAGDMATQITKAKAGSDRTQSQVNVQQGVVDALNSQIKERKTAERYASQVSVGQDGKKEVDRRFDLYDKAKYAAARAEKRLPLETDKLNLLQRDLKADLAYLRDLTRINKNL